MKLSALIALVSVGMGAAGPLGVVDPLQRVFRDNLSGHRAMSAQDADVAIAHYREALKRDPNNPRLHYNLGGALALAGKADEAAESFDEALRRARDPGLRRDAYFNRGATQLGASRWQEAARDFARALDEDPADADARRNLELALQREREQQQDPPPQAGASDRTAQGGRAADASTRERRDGKDASPERPSSGDDPQRGDQARRDAPGATESEPGSPEGDGSAEGNDAESELAERLLERLAKDEQSALRRALRGRMPANDSSRTKNW